MKRRHLVSYLFAAGAGVAIVSLALGSGTAVAASWSAASTIDGTNNLTSISCPTASFCAAVDTTDHSVMHSGTTWGAAVTADTSPLAGVSCTSAPFCMAVDTTGYAVTSTGGAWSARIHVESSSTAARTGVSCASPTFCVVVDGDGDASVYTGSTFTTHDVDGSLHLTSVSCPTTQFCAAVDSTGHAITTSNGWTSWTAAATIDGTNNLTSVSCQSSSFCEAVDSTGHAVPYTGTWGSAATIDGTNNITSVTCPVSGFCEAVDSTGHALSYTGSWGSATTIDGSNNLTSVSCLTSGFCGAVDSTGHFLSYGPGPLDHIVVAPATASIAAGGSQAFTATGYDAYGNSLGDVTSATTFSISPSGSCTGASCGATTVGSYTVTGTDSGKSATASLSVTAGPLASITVSPATATITSGGSQAYTAAGFDAYGNALGDVTSATTFAIAPNGSCTGASCTATVSGAHTVTGTDSGKTGTASLTVNPGPLDHITVSPAAGTIMAGGSQAYTAQGFDGHGNSLGDVTSSTTFTVAPNGSCTGASCSATVAGAHTVTGTCLLYTSPSPRD